MFEMITVCEHALITQSFLLFLKFLCNRASIYQAKYFSIFAVNQCSYNM